TGFFAFDHLGILAPGTSYTRTGDLPVPNGLSGTFYVQLRTAGPFEFIYTDNNAAVSGPVTIALSPSPDLVVTSIVAPTASTEGGSVDITWTVANQGDAAAVGSWRDRIALVKPGDPKAQPIQLGSFVYDRGLGAGLSYRRTERFRLPTKIEGAWQVVVTTNPDAEFHLLTA